MTPQWRVRPVGASSWTDWQSTLPNAPRFAELYDTDLAFWEFQYRPAS